MCESLSLMSAECEALSGLVAGETAAALNC